MLRFLALFVLASSCSGHIKIVSDGCPISLGESSSDSDYDIHSRFWASEDQVVSIKKVLAEKNIDCKKIKKISLKVGQTSGDIFASMIPFRNRMSVWLKTYE